MKILKFFIGILLLPLGYASVVSLAHLVQSIHLVRIGQSTNGARWLLGGFLFWTVLFFALPRPTRTYVLGHELTHAFWGLLMGARVSKLRVNARGGSVTLSKSNFIITLAPYFFPFYTMFVLVAYAAVQFVHPGSIYEPFWLALVGLTWSFHLTFTLQALSIHQPDIAEHGRLFSYAVIVILNAIGVGLWIVAVAQPTWREFSSDLQLTTAAAYTACVGFIQKLR